MGGVVVSELLLGAVVFLEFLLVVVVVLELSFAFIVSKFLLIVAASETSLAFVVVPELPPTFVALLKPSSPFSVELRLLFVYFLVQELLVQLGILVKFIIVVYPLAMREARARTPSSVRLANVIIGLIDGLLLGRFAWHFLDGCWGR